MKTKATAKKPTKIKPKSVRAAAIPLPTLKEGERWAGIILNTDGTPSHHVILLPSEAASVTWEKAKKWATKAGGELPTRREQSLLFANLKEHFQIAWYLSGAQHAAHPDYAWMQFFGNGLQINGLKSYDSRARAVRREKI